MFTFLKKTKKQTIPIQKTNPDLPDDVLINIFQFLNVSDLAKVPQLANQWNFIFNTPQFWSERQTSKNLQSYLDIALFNAVKDNRNINLIKRYCSLGANPNYKMNTCVSKKYGWLDTRFGCFLNVSPLSLAANATTSKYGEEVVKTLLSYDANPFVKSQFSLYRIEPPGIVIGEQILEETPAASARCKNIKTILLSAQSLFAKAKYMPSIKNGPLLGREVTYVKKPLG